MSRVGKAAREQCYASRDAFFAECVDAVAPNPEICAALRGTYEALCLPSWRSHFEQRRRYERARDARIAEIERQDADVRRDS